MREVTDKELLSRLTAGDSDIVDSEVSDPAILSLLQSEPVEQKEPQQTDFGMFSPVVGAGEAALSVLSGAVAEPISGLSGIASSLLSGRGTEGGARAVEGTQEALTYQPRSAEGQQYLQSIGETLAPIGNFFEKFNSTLGDFAYDTTGSPAAAAAAYSLPTLAASVLGFKGGQTLATLTPEQAKLRASQKTLLQDDVFKYSGDVADVKLNNKGVVVPDPQGEKLLDLGFTRNSTAVVTNSNPATKAKMAKMLDVFDSTSTNDVLKLSEKMSTVVGDSVRVRLGALNNRRKNLGKRLDSYVDTMDAPIQLDEPLYSFFSDLQKDFGITPKIKADGTLAITGMKKSPLQTSSLSSVKTLINDTVKLINQKSKNGVIQGKDAHKLKKLLDEMADAQKASKAGISNRTHGRLLALRQGINDSLGEAFPSYSKINGELAETITSMEPFKAFVKGNKSWDDANISEVIGAATKNMGGDTASAANLRQSIAKLEANMKKMGYNFQDDPRALLAFKQTVDDYFKMDAEALAKQAGKYDDAISSGLLDAGASMSVGNKFGVVHDIAKLRKLGLSKRKAEQLVKNKVEAKDYLRKVLKE